MNNLAMFFIQVVLLTWMQIKVLRNVFFWKLDRHPPPRNANNIEPYTFATFFPENVTPPPPHLRYAPLPWLNGVFLSTVKGDFEVEAPPQTCQQSIFNPWAWLPTDSVIRLVTSDRNKTVPCGQTWAFGTLV